MRELAEHVRDGIRAAGGTPLEFNTISISDGITMGTDGMRASLISREVIADSIELVTRGNLFDGLIVLVGCDKTIPGGVMALARLNIPGLILYGGSIAPGQFEGHSVTIQDVFEAVGAHARGKMTDAQLEGTGMRSVSRSGRVWWPIHREHHGAGLRISGHRSDGAFERSRHKRRQSAWLASSPVNSSVELLAEEPDALANHHEIRHRKCHRRRSRNRWLHERRAAPAGHRPRSRNCSFHRRFRSH